MHLECKSFVNEVECALQLLGAGPIDEAITADEAIEFVERWDYCILNFPSAFFLAGCLLQQFKPTLSQANAIYSTKCMLFLDLIFMNRSLLQGLQLPFPGQ